MPGQMSENDMINSDEFELDDGFCDSDESSWLSDDADNNLSIDPNYSGPANICFSKSYCKVFNFKFLIKRIDNDIPKMTYTLTKFNLKSSKIFRAKICQKLQKISNNNFISKFILSKIQITKISEGINWKEDTFPLVHVSVYGNFIRNFGQFSATDGIYNLHRNAYSDPETGAKDVGLINKIGNDITLRLNRIGLDIVEQLVEPNHQFLTATNFYNDFLNNKNKAKYDSSSCSCSKSLDLHFLIEKNQNLDENHYDKIDQLLVDLIRHFPADNREFKNRKVVFGHNGIRLGVDLFGIGNGVKYVEFESGFEKSSVLEKLSEVVMHAFYFVFFCSFVLLLYSTILINFNHIIPATTFLNPIIIRFSKNQLITTGISHHHNLIRFGRSIISRCVSNRRSLNYIHRFSFSWRGVLIF